MGSFNHKCNFSQLPAAYGDRIVVILGVKMTENAMAADNFSPGSSFTPISVPIRGIYNDYGGITDVDRTPAIKALEEYFSMDVVRLVDCAERISCDCENQVEEDSKKIHDIILKNLRTTYYNKFGLKFSYIMEHEAVFDKLMAMSDIAAKDFYYWTLPHSFLEELGYEKNVIGKERSYDVIIWKHEALPELKETCYVWKTEDFGDHGKVVNTIAKFCEYIGCDVPEKYNKSYYESRFMSDMKLMENPDKLMWHEPDYDEYSFLRQGARGLFHQGENTGISCLLLASLGEHNAHMKEEYMRGVIEIGLLYNSMMKLQMTWGNTSYYRQDVVYRYHVGFLKECLSLAEKKLEEEGDEDDD